MLLQVPVNLKLGNDKSALKWRYWQDKNWYLPNWSILCEAVHLHPLVSFRLHYRRYSKRWSGSGTFRLSFLSALALTIERILKETRHSTTKIRSMEDNPIFMGKFFFLSIINSSVISLMFLLNIFPDLLLMNHGIRGKSF